MKTKEIYLFVKDVVEICQKKVQHAEKEKLPLDLVEYERGRLFEACYILNKIEEIVFEDNE